MAIHRLIAAGREATIQLTPEAQRLGAPVKEQTGLIFFQCPLSGVKRTWRLQCEMSAYDPKRTYLRWLPRVAERRRANLSIRPAQSFFPEFDNSRRKFTPSDPGASAGFRPHKARSNLRAIVRSGKPGQLQTAASARLHFQELDESRDILFGYHGNPLRNVKELTRNNGCRCVGHHEKTVLAQRR